MADISLYRKYRPQNFQNLVGQDHIRTTLLNALKSGNPAHAYLFCGPRGTGKTSTARLLAKALNCMTPTEEAEPCDTCELCEAVREGTLIDLVEIDAASNRGIDEIRELKDKINFAPTRTKNKVYIIDEVHMLTKEAFNALLKTLEEPPPQVFFILATTESHKVPDTIISRCQRFDFKRITQKAITTRLMYIAQLENIETEAEAIDTIAHSAEGGLRDAIGLLEQLSADGQLTFARVREVLGLSGQSALETLYNYLKENSTKKALLEIQNLYAEGMDLLQFTKDFLEYCRQKMLTATENSNSQEVTYVLGVIKKFQKAYDRLKTTTIPQLPLEMAIIEITSDAMPVTETHPVQQPVAKAAPKVATAPTQSAPATQETPAESREHGGIKQNISEQEPETPQEKLPLTISYVKENWPRIVEQIKTPFARMSLKNGKPARLENEEVIIEFTAQFHIDKVNSPEIKLEIESAFDTIFEDKAKISFELTKVSFATQPQEEKVTEKKAEKEDDNLAKAAIDVFGGEFVED